MAKHTVFDPERDDPFILSRTAIDEFLKCQKCFYFKRRLGLKPPRLIPLTLAIATDAILKNDFDEVRQSGGQSHYVWETHDLNVHAFSHPDMEDWRNNFRGIRYLHEPTNQEITGAIDDVWERLDTGQLHVVDYKSTSKKDDPDIESGWGFGYKRQMEVYQWLFRKNGFDIHETGYFLYINGRKDTAFYDEETGGETVGRMLFRTTLIPYDGDTGWVDDIIYQCKDTLRSDEIPEGSEGCDSCRYFRERSEIE